MAQYRLRIGASGPPDTLPLWLSGAAINTWGQISNTVVPSAINIGFSGCVLANKELVFAAAGGHLTNYDNSVRGINLALSTPAWVTRKTISASFTDNANYYPDGTPAGRHLYSSIHYIPGNKVLLSGRRFGGYPGNNTGDEVDVFDLDTDTWDGVVPGSPGTSGSGYANCSPSGYYGVVQDGNGDIWSFLHTTGAAAKYTVSTNTWSQPTITGAISPTVRYPWALDTLRNQLFGLAFGNGEGAGTGMRAVKQNGTTQTAITFNSIGGAYEAWLAQAPQYACMCYDAANDRFLFMGTGAATIYVITPNSGTTWDMSTLSASGTAPTAPPSSGVPSRMHYIPEYQTVVLILNDSDNIYYLKVA